MKATIHYYKYNLDSTKAETEYTGLVWLLDQGISTENCIYYSYTGIFTFGWRKSLSEPERDALSLLLVGFPYNYELK